MIPNDRTSQDMQTAATSRRDFFRRIGQSAAVAALAAGGLFVRWRGRHGQSTSTCAGDGGCSGCGELARCELPQADDWRRKSSGDPS